MDYQAILDNAPLPILLYQDGRLVFMNPAGFDVFEQAGFSLTSEGLSQFDNWGRVAPDQLKQTREALQRVVVEGVTLTNLPVTGVDAEGNAISVLVSATPTEHEGRPAAAVSFVIIGLYAEDAKGGSAPQFRFRDVRHQRLKDLTARQIEVALLVADGLRTADIASKLGIKDSTLRSHLKAIYRKTGTHSRTELTRLVMGHR